MKPIAAVAATALLLCLLTIDPAGNLPLPEGPGLTIDEPFNVETGAFLIRAEWEYGLAALSPATQEEIFAATLNDHPPLGRVLLGVSEAVVSAVLPVDKPPGTLVTAAAARPASAICFALTVLLVGWATRRWAGDAAGFFAALVLSTTPRVFGHAHIASLESAMNLTYAAGVLGVAALWAKGPRWKTGLVCGVLWGLCLLTKIQAVLLPVPVGLWALWYFRGRAVVPLAAMAAAGLLTFFVGWPHLWIDPVGHFAKYFGSASDRMELHVFFAGERYGDRSVPWLYAPVMFAVTQPLAWLAGGLLGAWRVVHGARKSEDEASRRWVLLLASAVFPVLFFAVPKFATYDGVRLFLVAYPPWACVCGVGLAEVASRLKRPRAVHWAAAIVGFLLLLPQRPVWLSHYSLLVGGTRGAAALGVEPTYWGDSLTDTFWEEVVREVPAGSTVAVAPTLHQFQVPYYTSQSRMLADAEITLVAYSPETPADYVVAFRRRADLSREFAGEAIVEVRTWDGVRLSVLQPLGEQGTSVP